MASGPLFYRLSLTEWWFMKCFSRLFHTCLFILFSTILHVQEVDLTYYCMCLFFHIADRLWILSKVFRISRFSTKPCKKVYRPKICSAGEFFLPVHLYLYWRMFGFCSLTSYLYLFCSCWSCLIVKTQGREIFWRQCYIGYMGNF